MTLTAKDWASEFGDGYTERQDLDTSERRHFWGALIENYGIKSVLEVGCNTGTNLAQMEAPLRMGVDVNQHALDQVPGGIWTTHADATKLPFAANDFDLVFTFGVLIHIPPDEIEQAMREIVRVSRRYVFCGEYLGDDTVPYRGEILWRRDYGRLYQDLGLNLVERGSLKGEPWDRNEVHWWLLSKEA